MGIRILQVKPEGLTDLMKRVVSFIVFACSAMSVSAQVGNEWIHHDRPYLKIPVGRDGIYKVSHADLQQAGFPTGRDPNLLQLFHRGQEQAILVQGESDGVFNASDYIEFYGRRNDGTLDSTLYDVAAHQPHQLYNLYSDTTAYFLTYGDAAGKRMTTFSAVPSGQAAESFHWEERLTILKESYSGGVDYGSVQKTVFDQGEGWMGVQVVQGQEVSYAISGITDIVSTSGKPKLEVLLTGRGSMVHHVDIYAGARLLSSVSFQGYASQLHSQDLEWSDIDAGGNILIRIRVTGFAGVDRVSANYVRITFPQKLKMSGAEKKIQLAANTSGPSFVRIEAPPAGLRLFDISDPSSLSRIDAQITTTLDAMVPASSTGRRLLATAQVLVPIGMKRVAFRRMYPGAQDYVIITHPLLRRPARGYTDPVKAYGEYRALPEGGGFDTLVVNIGQLYDQFNYGERSPRAIYQFMKFLASAKSPDYLFLVGKGLDTNYGYARNPSAFTTYKDLVPTAGYPASDMAFTAGVNGTHAVATGRLAANDAAEVAAYLNKVKERDRLPFNDLRRKKVLHLSGGIEESEPIAFRNILREFEPTAEGVFLGGEVQAIAKQSTGIKLINIADEVNQGLGLITFFGHSAPNTLDFDIGLVTDPLMGYDNPEKYPFLLMNGCDAGSFFLNAAIPGENWINTPDKGAIGYIAHSSYGLLLGLQRYSSTFYQVAFSDSLFMTKGVGKVQQEVSKRYIDAFGSTPAGVSQIQQMVLLGDPAVKIFGAEKPDYALNDEGLSVSSFYREPITALTDSFKLNIPVRNFGMAVDKRIRLQITREFGSHTIEYDTIIPAVLYRDTVAMVIRSHEKQGFGRNKFTVRVDADDLVDELDESNNTSVFEYFIALNSTRNLYPYNYSIVNSLTVHLTFQYTDLLAGSRDYLLEVDTAAGFDSSFKQEWRISSGVLVRQSITLAESDSTVYYWRTKLADPTEDESNEWTRSSFLFIDDGPEGWAQMRFPQFERNEVDGLVMDPQIKELRFEETVSDLAIKTFSSASGKPRDSVSFKINRVEFNLSHEGSACRNNTINLVAFDRKSTQPYAGVYLKWYELLYEYGGRRLLCGREPYVINSYTPTELMMGKDDLAEYIDHIGTGDTVVLFNIGDAGFEQWPELARQELSALGISSAQLDNLKNGDAVVIFGRKGSAPGTAEIYHAPTTSLEVNRTIAGRYSSGSMSSVIIGPAQRWDRFLPRVREVETPDDFSFMLMGIKASGVYDTIAMDVRTDFDLSMIPAAEYPYLKIVFNASDDVDLTAVQLTKWLVLYEPVAEGLAFYRGMKALRTVYEGQEYSEDYGFVNIGNKTFSDSLTVRYDLINRNTPAPAAFTMKIAAPAPGDTTLFSVPFNTISRAGLNDVEIFVNPEIHPENDYDNNVILLQEHVNVLLDLSPPVLDVTFNGLHISNDALVSSNPEISVHMWDDSPFMLQTDTVAMKIFLAYPCDEAPCDFSPIYFTRDDVTWSAASDIADFVVKFTPGNLPTGRYVLRVEARDGTGNAAGEEPYEIAFRVDNESPLSINPPYPNPFTHSTQFDITIPGDDAGDHWWTLRLVDVNGSSVGTFFGKDGDLRPGGNSIVWDGRPLPAGIYFYRLIVFGSEETIELRGKIIRGM